MRNEFFCTHHSLLITRHFYSPIRLRSEFREGDLPGLAASDPWLSEGAYLAHDLRHCLCQLLSVRHSRSVKNRSGFGTEL